MQAGADRLARTVFDETGLRTVFHHHCAGYVETPEEIATLLDFTDSRYLGLVFDSGHYCYGTGLENCDIAAALDGFGDRVWYIHLKDCQPEIAKSARTKQWDYFTALRHGVFCELGKGCVDFSALLRQLSARKYEGYTLVEQDILPGMGSPKDSGTPQPRILEVHRKQFRLNDTASNLRSVILHEDTVSTNKLHIGIIGAGRIGRVHAETLAFRLPESEIVAITDVNREAAVSVASRCGIPEVTESAAEIFANPKIEAVLICSSTNTHADLIVEAAKAGKHIFCEKPIAHNLGQIDRALAAVKTAGVQLQIGFNRRFDANFARVRQAVATAKSASPT